MNTMQEALRELMRRTKDDIKSKTTKRTAVQKQALTEDKKSEKKTKEAMLPELWDQVYCTLIDAGDNQIYAICGGKGKYNPDQATVRHARSKYGDHVLSIIYDKDNATKEETDFFAEAERVAEKFDLETSRRESDHIVFFDIHIPQDEPVYFDFIPQKFRKKIALQNNEDVTDLPVSKDYRGKLSIDDVEQVTQESLVEDVKLELPVTILPENQILEFIESVPKATKDRGPASLTFTVGFVTEVDVASQFKENGRGHINKETGETLPTIKVVKCVETSGLYLEAYSSSKKTIAHRKQMNKYEEDPEFDMPPKREVASWLEPAEGYRGLFKSKSTGEFVLAPLVSKNSKARVKYFISVDGQALRETTKEEILPYLTPAKQAELISGREDKVKVGPDGKEIVSAAQPLNFYLKKIYRIGDKGQSIF